MNNNITKIKYGFIIGLVIIVGLISFYTYQAISRSDKVKVTIQAIPSDATITLNNKQYSTGYIYVLPGDYSISVKKDGFENYTKSVTFTKPTGNIDVALSPQSDTAKAWAAQHSSDYSAYEGRAGTKALAAGQSFLDKNPIVNHLPYENFLFTIGYFINPSDSSGNSIIITVDAAEGYRQAAINKIKEWGYQPASFNITFNNYVDPFLK